MAKIKLKTGYEFKASQILILSLFVSVTGLCSIVLSVIGFVKRVHGYNQATGLWCGSIVFIAGILGIVSSQIRRKCSVKVLMVSMLIGLIFATILLILSIYGVEASSTMNMPYITSTNTSDTRVINITTAVIAVMQMSLVIVCIILCFKCHEKGPIIINPPSPPISRRNVLLQSRVKSSITSASDGATNDAHSASHRYRSPRRPHPYLSRDDNEQREFLPLDRDPCHDQPQETMTFLPEDSVRMIDRSSSSRHNNSEAPQTDHYNRRYRSRNARRHDAPAPESTTRVRRSNSPPHHQQSSVNENDEVFVNANDSDYSTLVRIAHKEMLEQQYQSVYESEPLTTHQTPPVIVDEEELPPYSDGRHKNYDYSDVYVLDNALQNIMRANDVSRSDSADREVCNILTDRPVTELPPVSNSCNGDGIHLEQLATAVSSDRQTVVPKQKDDSALVSYDSNSMSLPMYLKRERHAQNYIAKHPINYAPNQAPVSAANFIIPKSVHDYSSTSGIAKPHDVVSNVLKSISTPIPLDNQTAPIITNFRRYDKGRLSERFPISSEKLEFRRLMSPRYMSVRGNRSDVTSYKPFSISKFEMLAPDRLNSHTNDDIDTGNHRRYRPVSHLTNEPYSLRPATYSAIPGLHNSPPTTSPLKNSVLMPEELHVNLEPQPPKFFYPPERLPSQFGKTTPFHSSSSGMKYRSGESSPVHTFMYSQNHQPKRSTEDDAVIARVMDELSKSPDIDYLPHLRISSDLTGSRSLPTSPGRLLSNITDPCISGTSHKSPLFSSVDDAADMTRTLSHPSNDSVFLKYIDGHRGEQTLSDMLKQPVMRTPRRSYPSATRRCMRLEQNAHEEPLYRHAGNERNAGLSTFQHHDNVKPRHSFAPYMSHTTTAYVPPRPRPTRQTSMFNEIL